MNIFRGLFFTSVFLYPGCPKPPQPPTPPEPVYSCKADPKWITAPQQPNEIAETESFCDFYQFSWQWFLAQVSPSTTNPDERVFERQRLFAKSMGKDQCNQEPQTGRQTAIDMAAPRFIKMDDFEDIQADTHALYDQNGNILLYNIWYSEQNCSATPKGFDAGTLELKVSWTKLEEPDPTYFMVQTEEGDDQPILLGMVGFHMAIFTPHHPEMIWVTWEHKDNAPNCDGSDVEEQDWLLASKEAAKCLAENKDTSKCSEYNFNVPEKFDGNPPHVSKPNEVCRMFPFGNEPGEAINGNDNAANLLAIQELNEQLIGKDGFLSKLDDKDPMKVWSNYEMVGGIWTKDGQASGIAPVPHKGGEADPNSTQRGSLELTNITMETFQQGADSYVPNCFGCHNYVPETPLTVSHIQSYLTE